MNINSKAGVLAIVCIVMGVMVAVVLLLSINKGWVHPEIRGIVRDAENPARGIEGVKVQVVRSEYTQASTLTDAEGKFELRAVSAMEFTFPGTPLKRTSLLLTRDGYADEKHELSLTSSELSGRNAAPVRSIEVLMKPL